MESSEIRLILLDFDGTLANTRRANARAYVQTLAEAGYQLTEEEYLANYFGMRCSEFLTRLGFDDPAERERLRLRKIALYPAFFDTVTLNRPLWEFCCQFRARGGKVWIVSTGSRANILNAMHHLGIGTPEEPAGEADKISTTPDKILTCGAESPSAKDKILTSGGKILTGVDKILTGGDKILTGVDGILTGADVARSKPAPDCFLEAMRREGCTPAETLIFEDSPVGIEAARRSGAAYFVVKL